MHGLMILLFTLGSLIKGNEEIKIVFAGDAMQHSAQIEAAKTSDGKYDYTECFDAITPLIDNADYAVVNLETPLAGAPYTGYPCFSAPDAYLDALAYVGFDMMLTANNHTLDKHSKGAARTIEQLDTRFIDHIGTYRNKHERDSVLPMIKNIGGFKIGFLNYTYGTNGIEATPPLIVDYIDRDKIASDINNLRNAGAELIAVCVHWGDEYKLLPNASQRSLADYLYRSGVDMIIGSHPHVIQPMEMRTRDDGSRCFLVYSLGNFISNMKTVDTRGGAIATVTISREKSGKANIRGASYRLVFTVPGNKSQNFRLAPVEEYIDGAWSPQCRAFEKSAENIFNRYNHDVPRDTSLIKRRRLPPLSSVLSGHDK